jgi:hypothetical protein
MPMPEKRALVTGASGGLGAAFARQLARRGYSLVLTSRRADKLQALADQIKGEQQVEVVLLPADLASRGAPESLFAQTEGRGLPVQVLINNAGFANHGVFPNLAWERIGQELDLNIRALTELCWRFLRPMRERRQGYVLNVASFIGYTPAPSYATYAAGKTYVRNFSEAIAHELAGSGVKVCSLCPGGIDTGFWEVADHRPRPIVRKTIKTAEQVAAIGLGALFGGRRNLVVGLVPKLNTFLLRFTPRRLMTPIAASLSKDARQLKPGS